jgi:hypothetical protein
MEIPNFRWGINYIPIEAKTLKNHFFHERIAWTLANAPEGLFNN